MNSGFFDHTVSLRDRFKTGELHDAQNLSEEDLQHLRLEFKDLQILRARKSGRVVDTFLKYFARRSNSVH